MTPNEWTEAVLHRLDKISDDISEMKLTVSGQAKDIAYHIRRTDLLEERMEQISDEVKPIAEHVQQLRGGWMLIVGLGVLVGVASGIWALFH